MINSPSPSFTPEEQELLSDFNAGELRSVATPELLDALRQSATAMGVKDQRINWGCPNSMDRSHAAISATLSRSAWRSSKAMGVE